MLRLHRRNLSPSKRFRLTPLQMVLAAVTPKGHHHINLCLDYLPLRVHLVCLFLDRECIFRSDLFLAKSVQRMQVMSLGLLSKDFFQVLLLFIKCLSGKPFFVN